MAESLTVDVARIWCEPRECVIEAITSLVVNTLLLADGELGADVLVLTLYVFFTCVESKETAKNSKDRKI